MLRPETAVALVVWSIAVEREGQIGAHHEIAERLQRLLDAGLTVPGLDVQEVNGCLASETASLCLQRMQVAGFIRQSSVPLRLTSGGRPKLAAFLQTRTTRRAEAHEFATACAVLGLQPDGFALSATG